MVIIYKQNCACFRYFLQAIEIKHQLAIVLVLFPLLFLLRNYNYPKLFLRPASAAIGVVACWWLVERTLDLQSGWTSF